MSHKVAPVRDSCHITPHQSMPFDDLNINDDFSLKKNKSEDFMCVVSKLNLYQSQMGAMWKIFSIVATGGIGSGSPCTPLRNYLWVLFLFFHVYCRLIDYSVCCKVPPWARKYFFRILNIWWRRRADAMRDWKLSSGSAGGKFLFRAPSGHSGSYDGPNFGIGSHRVNLKISVAVIHLSEKHDELKYNIFF